MKIWFGYGSEHSMNLVMIGRFKDVSEAVKAKQKIEWLTDRVSADLDAGLMKLGEESDRFTEPMLDLLMKANIASIRPAELEQFAYDVSLDLKGDQIVLTTEEIDVSAFLKVFVENGARIEVFSAHDYPGSGHGRKT